MGGVDATSSRKVNNQQHPARTTATAEIYDPATNAWTATGSLQYDRAHHAALLLPTGQVLIVGGYKSDLEGNVVYPNVTELYDPDTGIFSVVDHLDYGLSDPKLVLQQDGGVFVAGQIQEPMEPPVNPQSMRWDPESKSFKPVAANAMSSLVWTTGMAMMGQVQGPSTKLTILRPSGAQVPEQDKATLGGIVQVNLKENAQARPTLDDYLRLRIPKLKSGASADHSFKLHFTGSRIAIWQDMAKTQPVVSDTTTFSIGTATTLYVEGLQPSADLGGEMISLQLFHGADLLEEDQAKIVVAQMVFGIMGDGQTGESVLRAYLAGEQISEDKRPSLPNLSIIRNGTGCYSVWVGKTQAFAQMALSADGGNVVYDGHSNFGIGFAFSKNMTGIQDFMNVGEEWAGINWPYLVGPQEQTQFKVSYSEYGDNLDTAELYDPYLKPHNIYGNINPIISVPEFFNCTQVIGGVQLHPTYGQTQIYDMHYGTVGNSVLVVHNGASDMPAMRWKKLYLASCTSGQYYYRIFNHGTLFYTTESCSSDNLTKAYIKAIIGGQNDEGIYAAINAIELGALHDYKVF